jgi:hypothetical protein
VVSYKNSLPFFESFRQFNPLTKLPLTNNWSGFTTSVSPNDSDFFKWGNTVIFNSLTEVKDSSYFNNNGIYGNADTLILNPIDFSKLNTSNQHVLSFWIRCFAQTKTNDSLYLEGLDNQGRWQRLWATNKFDTVYKKINVNLINGRFFHSFFMVRFINKGTYLNTCEDPIQTTYRYYYETWSGSGEKDSLIYNLHENNYKKYELGKVAGILINLNGNYYLTDDNSESS